MEQLFTWLILLELVRWKIHRFSFLKPWHPSTLSQEKRAQPAAPTPHLTSTYTEFRRERDFLLPSHCSFKPHLPYPKIKTSVLKLTPSSSLSLFSQIHDSPWNLLRTRTIINLILLISSAKRFPSKPNLHTALHGNRGALSLCLPRSLWFELCPLLPQTPVLPCPSVLKLLHYFALDLKT